MVPTRGTHGVQERGLAFPIHTAATEKMPIQDGYFDVVFSSHALMLFADHDQGLAETARVLKPSGTVLLVNTTHVSRSAKENPEINAMMPAGRSA